MKTKKILLGSIIASIAFCTVIALNSFVFPAVLAMTSEKSEIRTTGAPELPTLKPDETETDKRDTGIADINMISEEKAIETAVDTIQKSSFPGKEYVNALSHKTRLVKGTSPLNTAIWSVAFYDESKIERRIYFVTINAMTGKVSSVGMSEGREALQKSIIRSDIIETQKGGTKTFSLVFGRLDSEGLLTDSFIIATEDTKEVKEKLEKQGYQITANMSKGYHVAFHSSKDPNIN